MQFLCGLTKVKAAIVVEPALHLQSSEQSHEQSHSRESEDCSAAGHGCSLCACAFHQSVQILAALNTFLY